MSAGPHLFSVRASGRPLDCLRARERGCRQLVAGRPMLAGELGYAPQFSPQVLRSGIFRDCQSKKGTGLKISPELLRYLGHFDRVANRLFSIVKLLVPGPKTFDFHLLRKVRQRARAYRRSSPVLPAHRWRSGRQARLRSGLKAHGVPFRCHRCARPATCKAVKLSRSQSGGRKVREPLAYDIVAPVPIAQFNRARHTGTSSGRRSRHFSSRTFASSKLPVWIAKFARPSQTRSSWGARFAASSRKARMFATELGFTERLMWSWS